MLDSTSFDTSEVLLDLQRTAMSKFDALRAQLRDGFDPERTIVDRAAVTAEFNTYMDETLDAAILDESTGEDGVGERLSASQAQAIKDIIRSAEQKNIDTSFGQRQKAADQKYDRDVAAGMRARYDSATNSAPRYDEYGDRITYNRNPTGPAEGYRGEKFTDLSAGALVEPVTAKDGTVYMPGGLSPEMGAPPMGDPTGPLNQADSYVTTERIDPAAVARMEMRRTRGQDIFSRSMSSRMSVLSRMIEEG
jgi:hypothetical protein